LAIRASCVRAGAGLRLDTVEGLVLRHGEVGRVSASAVSDVLAVQCAAGVLGGDGFPVGIRDEAVEETGDVLAGQRAPGGGATPVGEPVERLLGRADFGGQPGNRDRLSSNALSATMVRPGRGRRDRRRS
jgi:hypothetical protein